MGDFPSLGVNPTEVFCEGIVKHLIFEDPVVLCVEVEVDFEVEVEFKLEFEVEFEIEVEFEVEDEAASELDFSDRSNEDLDFAIGWFCAAELSLGFC